MITKAQSRSVAPNFGSTTVSDTFASNTTAGSLIVVDVYIGGGTIVSVTDSKGNAYSLASAKSTGSRTVATYYNYAGSRGASHQITVTQSGTGWIWIALTEYDRFVGTGDPLGDTDGAGYASLSGPDYDFTIGTVTPSSADDLIHCFYKYDLDTPDGFPAGLTAITGGSYSYRGYKVAGSTSDYTATGSQTADMYVVGSVMVFKADVSVWVDVADFHEELIDASLYPGGSARVVCKLWAPGDDAHPPPITMKARLVSLLESVDADGNYETDAEVGRSADVDGEVPTDATFAVTLVGKKRHKLQLAADATETDLWCSPDARVVP